MNSKLPIALFIGIITLWAGFFVVFTQHVQAVSIAEQTQEYDSGLNVWQAIQELSSNLSGTAQSLTFRVSTASTNLNQFDYTAQNSRIYDKDNNNSYIGGCVPAGINPYDSSRGLTFTTTNVPTGYEDVTIDFSCRNYSFIPGHRYLLILTNANRVQYGGKRMKLASASYSGTSNDYFTGGGVRYAFDNGSCDAYRYVWNSQSANNGCNIFSSPKADLYFILNNNAPPPRLPVIFIPGIGGSEMKASQDIFWSKDDGHGGTYSHGYANNEKIWVNQDEAAKLGDDDYFDVLKLKADGVTPEADLSLTGRLTSFGYPDIDSFFTEMGYSKGTNFFVFPYDWRKDVRSTKDSLDTLIESAKIASGQSKVNLVVHSMGGLVARYYISDTTKAAKVNKLIELGVPHLGSTWATKALMYGAQVGPSYIFGLLALNPSEVKDIVQNLTGNFQLMPSIKYFDFYNDSSGDRLYPFRDDRDIDNNSVLGPLNFNQIKNLLSNLNYNMKVFNLAEQFHNDLDPVFSQTNNTKVYEIVGTAQPTLGQIHETWWITWPFNLIPKTEELYINGDGTVPLYSASLKNDSLDISGATKIYYVEQKHGDLVENSGPAMQTVKAILDDDNNLPVEVKDMKISLAGQQLSLDDGELDLYDEGGRHCGLNNQGEIEENIPGVTCTTSGNTRHAFIKKTASKVKVTATRKKPSNISKTTALKKRVYQEDKISKTTVYREIPLPQTGKVEFTLDPALDSSPAITLFPDSAKTDSVNINPTSEAIGSAALDQIPPVTTIQVSGTKDASGIYTDPVIVTLTASDTESGILKIEYSVDNGETVQTYTGPFIITKPGQTILQTKAVDNLGNEEMPQTTTINIAAPPAPVPNPTSAPTSTPTPTPTPTPTATPVPTQTPTPTLITQHSVIPTLAPTQLADVSYTSVGLANPKPAVLGVTSDQRKKFPVVVKKQDPGKWLIIILGGIISLISISLTLAFFNKPPRKM